jgi:hypothetical protein
MLPHHGTRAKEFLTSDLVEGGTGMLEHVKLVEHHLGLLQHRADGVEIRPMHVGADRRDRRALPACQVVRQQRRGRRFAPVLLQPQHLAADHIGQHRPEPLALAALDLVEADVPRLPLWTSLIPLGQKRFSARRALLQLTPWRTAA